MHLHCIKNSIKPQCKNSEKKIACLLLLLSMYKLFSNTCIIKRMLPFKPDILKSSISTDLVLLYCT